MHIINPVKSTKGVTTFSWIFHVLLIDFSIKIFEIFFTNADAFGACGTMWVKKEENLFRGDLHLPSQNARAKVRLLYFIPRPTNLDIEDH